MGTESCRGLKDSRAAECDIVKVTKGKARFCFPDYRERTVIRITRKFGILLAVLLPCLVPLYGAGPNSGEEMEKDRHAAEW